MTCSVMVWTTERGESFALAAGIWRRWDKTSRLSSPNTPHNGELYTLLLRILATVQIPESSAVTPFPFVSA
jgi:hypothetical protein